MSNSLSGKRALVCGASAGIGRATAMALAGRGCKVILVARRGERLRVLQDEIESSQLPKASVLIADLENREDLLGKVQRELDLGPIHILINNTGGPKAGPILNAGEQEFLSAFGRHLLAAHRLVQLLYLKEYFLKLHLSLFVEYFSSYRY